jgi:hypothetical protein
VGYGDAVQHFHTLKQVLRAASRQRMAANGFQCRFVASAIVPTYDRGRELISRV